MLRVNSLFCSSADRYRDSLSIAAMSTTKVGQCQKQTVKITLQFSLIQVNITLLTFRITGIRQWWLFGNVLPTCQQVVLNHRSFILQLSPKSSMIVLLSKKVVFKNATTYLGLWSLTVCFCKLAASPFIGPRPKEVNSVSLRMTHSVSSLNDSSKAFQCSELDSKRFLRNCKNIPFKV